MVIVAGTRCPFVNNCEYAENCFGTEDRDTDFICDLVDLIQFSSCPL